MSPYCKEIITNFYPDSITPTSFTQHVKGHPFLRCIADAYTIETLVMAMKKDIIFEYAAAWHRVGYMLKDSGFKGKYLPNRTEKF